jgi:hypothetical protein
MTRTDLARVGAGAIGLALLLGGCSGTTTTAATTGGSDTSIAAADDGSAFGLTPGSNGTSPGSVAPPAATAEAGVDGVYALTGTQTCKTPGGAAKVADTPLFPGSSMTIKGNEATVNLSSEPRDTPLTVAGSSLHISFVYDGTGHPVTTQAGAYPGPTDYLLTIDAVVGSDGTVTGTGQDTGVNCAYTFSGKRGAPTTSGPTGSGPTTTAATVADPCNHIRDPRTGAVYDEWKHAGPGLGDVRVVSDCELPWALANFVPGPPTQVLVHWDGQRWTQSDQAAFCTSYAGPKPTQLVGEGQPGRIWTTLCWSASATTTSIRPPATDPPGPLPTDHG